MIGRKLIFSGSDFSDVCIGMIPNDEPQPDVPNTTSRAIPLVAIPKTYLKADSSWQDNTSRATTFGNVRAGDVLEFMNPDSTFENKAVVAEVDISGMPEFSDGRAPNVETYVAPLTDGYITENYRFAKDCRFLAVMADNLNSKRDYTNYTDFCLYQLRREYEIGVPTPIHAYYCVYMITDSTLVWTRDDRAVAVLDLRAGDIVEAATADIVFNVVKLTDKTHTYEETIVDKYTTTKWTSDVEQRVVVMAKSLSNPNGTVAADLNAVFKVTFNS